MGRLFVFEGPDGVGKTTIINEVEKRLYGSGQACSRFSFPGRESGTLGAHIYALHHQPAQFGVEGLSALSLQILHVAAHVDTIEQHILPLLRRGETVLLDRYWWSTWIYGSAAKVPVAQLNQLLSVEHLIWQDATPTTLFLMSRSSTSVPQEIAQTYRKLAEQESAKYPVVSIKNESRIDQVADEILKILASS